MSRLGRLTTGGGYHQISGRDGSLRRICCGRSPYCSEKAGCTNCKESNRPRGYALMAHFFLGPFFGPVWRDVSRTFPSRRGVPRVVLISYARNQRNLRTQVKFSGRSGSDPQFDLGNSPPAPKKHRDQGLVPCLGPLEAQDWPSPLTTAETPYLSSGRDGSPPQLTGGTSKCIPVL